MSKKNYKDTLESIKKKDKNFSESSYFRSSTTDVNKPGFLYTKEDENKYKSYNDLKSQIFIYADRGIMLITKPNKVIAALALYLNPDYKKEEKNKEKYNKGPETWMVNSIIRKLEKQFTWKNNLSEYKILLNRTDANGRTLVHYACDKRVHDIRILKCLEERGAKCHDLDNKGVSPLQLAQSNGFLNNDIAQFLKKKEKVLVSSRMKKFEQHISDNKDNHFEYIVNNQKFKTTKRFETLLTANNRNNFQSMHIDRNKKEQFNSK